MSSIGRAASIAATFLALNAVAPSHAVAFSLTNSLGTLEFLEKSGDFEITGGETDDETFRLFQDVTGPNLDLFATITGLPSLIPYNVIQGYDDNNQPIVLGQIYGFWFESVLTNRTDSAWTFFDHELQENYQVASPDDDGLSFAQGLGIVPISDGFSALEQVEDVRDFVNFSGGTVGVGETVTFRYFVADWTPEETFFLRQRPNFSAASGSFVEPPASEPVPPTQSEPQSETPSEPSPAPSQPQDVPEPGAIAGLLAFGAIAYSRRRAAA